MKAFIIFIIFIIFANISAFNLINPKHPKKFRYWDDPRIHNLGNNNLIHALIAPISTKLIDIISYNNINVRQQILNQIPDNQTILDLCCGIGYSTKDNQIGYDNSKTMIDIGNIIHPNKELKLFNIENLNEDKKFDVVTCMFSFHEIPQKSRKKIIQKSLKIANKRVIIIDISPKKIPSKLMLSGEPYLLEYLQNIDCDLKYANKNYELIKNHVKIWEFIK